MKKYSILILLAGSLIKAQIAVGKQALSGSSVILEFSGMTQTALPDDTDTGNIKGLILPVVAASPVYAQITPSTDHPQNGTFLFDKQNLKVRMFENGGWIDMSDAGNGGKIISNAGTETGNGVIIGATTSNAKGALVLESSDKALILPHIKNPHTAVKSPYPGMMCFDTVSKSVAVFDGNKWNYWK